MQPQKIAILQEYRNLLEMLSNNDVTLLNVLLYTDLTIQNKLVKNEKSYWLQTKRTKLVKTERFAILIYADEHRCQCIEQQECV